jgi:hypothetical protein
MGSARGGAMIKVAMIQQAWFIDSDGKESE